jgi:hypothetical protein
VPLAETLLEGAERCEQALQSHFAALELPPDRELKRVVIFALAAMKTAATPAAVRGAADREALQLVVALAGAARDRLHGAELDGPLAVCAAECDRAVRTCEAALRAEID